MLGITESDDSCDGCVGVLNGLFDTIQDNDDTLESLSQAILANLTCPDNYLCDTEKTGKTWQYIRDDVIFTDEGAKDICTTIDGACSR